MASLQSKLKLANGFRVTKPLFRNVVILPPDCESFFWSSEPATQDVVEGVQVVTPRKRSHHAINLTVEFLQRRETLAVDFVCRQIALRQETSIGRLHQKEKANLISQTGLY